MSKPRNRPTDTILRLRWQQPDWPGAPQGYDDCLARALKTLKRACGFIAVDITDAATPIAAAGEEPHGTP